MQNTVRWRSNRRCLGTPGQTKVSGDRQTHEICCLAAKCEKISILTLTLKVD